MKSIEEATQHLNEVKEIALERFGDRHTIYVEATAVSRKYEESLHHRINKRECKLKQHDPYFFVGNICVRGTC